MGKWAGGSNKLLHLLRERFKAPEAVLLEEVGDGTGFACRRHLDAISMGCWPSTGLDLCGYEIKVSRSDWRKELDQPEKAAPFLEFLDAFWVVAPPGIVKLEELPQGWGLMEPTRNGSRLKTARRSELRPEGEKPAPPDRHFLASLLRKANDARAPNEKDRGKIRSEVRQEMKGEAREDFELELASAQKLREVVKRFQKTAGVNLSAYDHQTPERTERQAEAFRFARDLLAGRHYQAVLLHVKSIETQAAEFRARLEELVQAAKEGS